MMMDEFEEALDKAFLKATRQCGKPTMVNEMLRSHVEMLSEAQKERYAKIRQAIEDYSEKINKSPETARAALVAEGIYNPDGTLHENYGGKPYVEKNHSSTAQRIEEDLECRAWQQINRNGS